MSAFVRAGDCKGPLSTRMRPLPTGDTDMRGVINRFLALHSRCVEIKSALDLGVSSRHIARALAVRPVADEDCDALLQACWHFGEIRAVEAQNSPLLDTRFSAVSDAARGTAVCYGECAARSILRAENIAVKLGVCANSWVVELVVNGSAQTITVDAAANPALDFHLHARDGFLTLAVGAHELRAAMPSAAALLLTAAPPAELPAGGFGWLPWNLPALQAAPDATAASPELTAVMIEAARAAGLYCNPRVRGLRGVDVAATLLAGAAAKCSN
jgi:hypothetical protein